ncbi:MAG: response regulator transcription factor [Bacteroidota bacterium]
MKRIKVLVADNHFLSRTGLKALVEGNEDFKLAAEVDNGIELLSKVAASKPEVIIIDFTTANFSLDHIKQVIAHFPFIKILAISSQQDKNAITSAIKAGVTSYLLKECDREEITQAIYATAAGEQFFCGKIVSYAMNRETDTVAEAETISCEGIRISRREVEIIRLVAEGLSNKEIAERLFLSVHTVTTHRKNIMSKLGVNNTAGLMMFAIRNEIISPNPFLFEQRN